MLKMPMRASHVQTSIVFLFQKIVAVYLSYCLENNNDTGAAPHDMQRVWKGVETENLECGTILGFCGRIM